jgi:hypothetical protein
MDRAPRGWAAWFWEAAGATPGFPRDIIPAASYALPLVFVPVSELSLRAALLWLRERGLAIELPPHDGLLHGLLVAQRDSGVVFLHGGDPPAEQRFTAAHELAHYLLDYHVPRERIRRRLGAAALEALESGGALPSEQHLDAILAHVPLRVRTHAISFLTSGGLLCDALQAEFSADRLALELLAPAEEVWRRCRAALSGTYAALVGQVQAVLSDEFALPPGVAQAYGRQLAWEWGGGRSVREWLGPDTGAIDDVRVALG